MERRVKFADYQEQTASDHNNLQAYAAESLDHLTFDAVTKTRRYAGFAVTKSAQAEVTVQAGRFYDSNGSIFNRGTPIVQSVISHLAAASRRIVAITASGNTVDTDLVEREVLVDVETGQTESESVSITLARQAVISFIPGSESTDPTTPAIPATHVLVATVLVDTTQVVSVTMAPLNEVESTEDLDLRARALELFKTTFEPIIAGLKGDIAALWEAMKNRGSNQDLHQIWRDIATLKELAELPDEGGYGADRFLDALESDVDNTFALGYDAKVEMGIRFPDANADILEMDIFSANDPNASKTDGFLLPAWTHSLRINNDITTHALGISQYGFQTFDLIQGTMSRERLRYGAVFTACTNSSWWKSGQFNPITGNFERAGETFEVLNVADMTQQHAAIYLKQIFRDRITEPYWYTLPVNHSITGALVAQSFLAPNDMWATKLEFRLIAKGGNENVHVAICELTAGVPDLSKTIAKVTVPHANLISDSFIAFAIPPTFLKAGRRYAFVFVSNANHQIAMSSGSRFLDGSFFYSTDGAFFQGDLTRDIVFRLYAAKFNNAISTVELEAWNLDGGIRYIDAMADMVTPESCQAVFEVLPNGATDWTALVAGESDPFASAPPLVRARIRFVGTQDIQAGIKLTGSTVQLARPKLTFKHVSEAITIPITGAVAGNTASITVETELEYFDDHIGGGPPTQPHDHDCSIVFDPAGTPTTEGAASQADEVLEVISGNVKRIRRTYLFNTLPAGETSFVIVQEGDTNAAGSTYHVASRVHYVTPVPA